MCSFAGARHDAPLLYPEFCKLMSSNQAIRTSIIPAFLRDIRVLQILGQIIFVIVVVTLASQLVTSIFASLASKGLTPNFTFLSGRAGFDISNAPAWYSSDSNYGTAFVVGLTNTLRVVSVGLVLATVLGVFIGIFLLSSNWLIRNIARAYIEILRNTPLLIQLYIWYFIVLLSLPEFRQPITFPGEGVVGIPIRLFLYVLIYLIARWWLRRESGDAPRRHILLTGLLTAYVVMELAFQFSTTQPGWQNLYGGGNMGTIDSLIYLVIYLVVSLIFIVGAWFSPAIVRWRLVGLAGGQLFGGLIFYFGIVPNSAYNITLYPVAFMSVRGFVFPEVAVTPHFGEWMAFVGIGIALAAIMWGYFGRITETTGKPYPRAWYAFLAVLLFSIGGWLVVTMQPLPESIPVTQEQDGVSSVVLMPLTEARQQGLLNKVKDQFYTSEPVWIALPRQRINRAGIVTGLEYGSEIAPEYIALLIGLVVYTSNYIAEIVRAGIMAVPRGQIEASRALGFSTSQTLRMIVLPQALRVIIPPLGNQYLNLSKNSSLAVAIAYADLVFVTNTIMNQSGQSVTGITMLMIVYLIMSLTISLFNNLANRRFQLVTR